MKITDVVKRAFGNVRRNKVRTFLTSLSVAVGAMTLSLTFGLSTAVNQLVNDGLSTSVENVELYITKESPSEQKQESGIKEYRENEAEFYGFLDEGPQAVEFMTEEEILKFVDIDGVTAAFPLFSIAIEYVQLEDGDKRFVVEDFDAIFGEKKLATGTRPTDNNEVVISHGYLEAFGKSAGDIIGQNLTIVYEDPDGNRLEKQLQVSGVLEEPNSLGGGDLGSIIATTELVREVYDAQSANSNDEFVIAAVVLDKAENEDAVRQAITDSDNYKITSLGDILQQITSVLNIIKYGLLGFGGIALLAATFGIVNTQLMSVYERTKEIGLFKAMGMSNLGVRGIFSFEATWIGVIGAGMGVGLAYGFQALVNGVWGDSLSGFNGTIISIQPTHAVQVVIGLSLLSFIAGVLPARKAARLDPIAALRDE